MTLNEKVVVVIVSVRIEGQRKSQHLVEQLRQEEMHHVALFLWKRTPLGNQPTQIAMSQKEK
jgi:hypothetical protein